ncbi:hypothetical protein ACFLSF_01905, partial [Candidatus Bipolaricaulota bacterium]
SGNRNPDGQDDVRRSIELVRGGGWESPDSRFLQVLDVAEQVPLAALDNLDAVGLLFQQHLRGFAGSLVRGAKDPKEMNIPGFGMTRQVSSRMLSLSRIIWRRAGGELAEACLKGGASQDNLDRLRVHRMIHTFETLGTIKRIPSGQGSLTIKCESEPERVLVREVLEYEFLREQLQAGKGLECMYDILPLTRRPEGYWEGRRTRHHALMEGLWENTQLDPDRDTQRYANCEWLPPTCLDDKPWTKKNRRSR